MANRLGRDVILLRALALIDSPRLNELDQPTAGTISATALSIGWLQEALDLAHNLFPMAGQLKTTSLTFQTGVATYTISTIASDFILDFKNGIVLANDNGRLDRKGVNWLLSQRVSSSSRGKPRYYGIYNGLLLVNPVPSADFIASSPTPNPATLYYYALPTVLSASTVPSFPTDINLVEFVHLRGREWIRELPAGTAEKYMIDAVARLQSAGLGSEAEADDVITLDRQVFPGGGTPIDSADWFTNVNAV